jgi:type 1 glutamine amidotransferase
VSSHRTRILNPDHPITEGVRDFVVTDEQHYMDYDKDRSHIFMQSENVEGLDYRGFGPIAPAGWAFDYGSGRVCYMSPGHLITALWNPEYEKLQQNAVRWLLKET